MGWIIAKIKAIPRVLILAVALIGVGLAIMIPKGREMRSIYQEINYAKTNNFEAGNPSVDLLRPWMTVRYIAASYGVPQKYLFDATGIQIRKESSMIAVNRLNQIMHLSKQDGQPELLGKLREAIIKYRENPVVTGFMEKHVEDWMTIQYISNSTGIPPEKIITEMKLPADINQYIPIGPLSEQINYPGGVAQMVADLQKLVDPYSIKP